MTDKNKLEQQYDRIRQEAIDNNEPTAIVLAENRIWGETQLTVASFSIRDFVEQQGAEETVRLANDEARSWGKPVWVVDLVGRDFVSEPDAFELAWQARECYHKSRMEEVEL